MAVTSVRRVPRFVFLSDALNVGWRLLAANNRPHGRAVHAEPSLEACRASAQRMSAGAADAGRTESFDSVRGVWTWAVSLDGQPAAVCVHSYLRRIECHRALHQFLAAAAQADPADGVLRNFGPRSLRGYAVMSS